MAAGYESEREKVPPTALLRLLMRAARQPADPDDPDSLDRELVGRLAGEFDRWLTAYYRLEVDGIDKVPPGPALLVGNHNSGTSFVELLGLGARWYVQRGQQEPLYGLAHDALMALPGLRNLLAHVGGIRACHQNAQKVLRRGEKVIVFPGGNQEAFRPWRERHRIRFAGHQGFVRLALRTSTPIVPVVTIGGHEGFVVLHDGQRLARTLRLDRLLGSSTMALYLGLPWGVGVGPMFHLPLPTKVRFRFLDPLDLSGHGPEAADDPQLVQRLYDEVVERLQQALDQLAAQRRWPLLG